jgi:hypothetical protein
MSTVVLWLLHGVVHHGDAFFFVQRVTAYRQALGEGGPLVVRVLGPAISLASEAPEVVVPLVLGLSRSPMPASFRRPLLGAAALVASLMLGELGGGGPTHHAARALLPVWFVAAAMLGQVAERWFRAPAGPFGLLLAGTLAMLALRGASLPDFADRRDALAIGESARKLGAPALLVDAPDYAHLAVTAAYGQPSRASAFDDRDPRKPRAPDPFATPKTLSERLRAHSDAWLVVTRAHAAMARKLGAERASNQSFVLVEPRAATTR